MWSLSPQEPGGSSQRMRQDGGEGASYWVNLLVVFVNDLKMIMTMIIINDNDAFDHHHHDNQDGGEGASYWINLLVVLVNDLKIFMRMMIINEYEHIMIIIMMAKKEQTIE